MSAACHPCMRTWERFSVLLLHTRPEGLGLGLLVGGRGCWPQVRGAQGWGCSSSGPRGPCSRGPVRSESGTAVAGVGTGVAPALALVPLPPRPAGGAALLLLLRSL